MSRDLTYIAFYKGLDFAEAISGQAKAGPSVFHIPFLVEALKDNTPLIEITYPDTRTPTSPASEARKKLNQLGYKVSGDYLTYTKEENGNVKAFKIRIE
jgi:hypothetical protein